MQTDVQDVQGGQEVVLSEQTHETAEAGAPKELKFGFRSTLDGDYEITKKLGTTAVPLRLPGQACCLVSKAGPELSTKASSVVVQIVGTFADEQERQMHIDESTFNMLTFTAKTAEPFFVGSRELSSEEQVAAVDRIVSNTETAFDQRMQEEREYIERKKTGDADVHQELEENAQKQNRYLQKVEETIHGINQSFFHNIKSNRERKKMAVRKFSPMSCVPGQAFSVVSVLRDPLKEIEPDQIEDEWAVAVWGCFSTSSEAEIYKSDTLQHERHKWDHYIVPMYKPIFLDLTRTKLSSAKNVFRFDVHSEMEARQLADESMIEELKKIPRDEHGRMIKESAETAETDETDETDEAGGGTK